MANVVTAAAAVAVNAQKTTAYLQSKSCKSVYIFIRDICVGLPSIQFSLVQPDKLCVRVSGCLLECLVDCVNMCAWNCSLIVRVFFDSQSG